MKEVQFIKNNSERWREVELFLSKKTSFQDPDKLAELFIQLTDDLSYSKTFYPQSKTTQYLNTLASKLHQSVYKGHYNSTGIQILWRSWQNLLFIPLFLGHHPLSLFQRTV